MQKIKAFIEAEAILLVAVLMAAVISIAGTSLVLGAIPDNNGQIHACRANDTGVVRIIDTESESCTGSETAISWDQYNKEIGTRYGDLLPSSFPNNDATGADLSFRNMSHGDFQNTNLSDVAMTRSDFSDSDFSGAVLNLGSEYVNFTGATFSGANMQLGGALTHSNFSSADFSGVTINNEGLSSSNFSGANFTNSVLGNTSFNNSTGLDSATLSGVTWSNVTCPDGTNSDAHDNTCTGHLTP